MTYNLSPQAAQFLQPCHVPHTLTNALHSGCKSVHMPNIYV